MNDEINHDSPIFQKNRRKILKWVFLLLQQHHERLGLKVRAWSGPDGIPIPRLTFFFDPIRENGKPVCLFPLDGEQVTMQMYQWEVGVFQPLRGSPQLYPDQSKLELRTKHMVPWFNNQLRIQEIYSSLDYKLFPYVAPNPQWAARAKRYLFSWNVLGLYLKQLPHYIRLTSLDACLDYSKFRDFADRFTGDCDPEDIVVFHMKAENRRVFWLHTGRIVRVDGESLDFYQLQRGGLGLDDVVKRVAEFMGDPNELGEQL